MGESLLNPRYDFHSQIYEGANCYRIFGKLRCV